MMRRLIPLVLAASTALPALAADHRIEIRDMAYSPADLTVAVGDTIMFVNQDGPQHTATAEDGSFDTGRLGRGQAARIRVTVPGIYTYFCTIHPRMRGRFTVE